MTLAATIVALAMTTTSSPVTTYTGNLAWAMKHPSVMVRPTTPSSDIVALEVSANWNPSASKRTTQEAVSVSTTSVASLVRSLWSQYVSPAAAEIALPIGVRESRLDPTAVNPISGAAGIFQLLGHGPVPSDPYSQIMQAIALCKEAAIEFGDCFQPWRLQ